MIVVFNTKHIKISHRIGYPLIKGRKYKLILKDNFSDQEHIDKTGKEKVEETII